MTQCHKRVRLGRPARDVRGLGGHSSGAVTDIYRHLRPEVYDAELELVDEYLGLGVDALVAVV